MGKYYIGLIPDQNLSNLCLKYKNQAEERFACSQAKRSPAHLTLVPPFNSDRQQLALMQNLLTKIVPNYTAFELTLNGWGHFKERTIYLGIKLTPELSELFDDCYDYLVQLITPQNSKKFIPHITIINHDIAAEQFDQAFRHFGLQPFPKSATFAQLVIFELIENESGNYWQQRVVYNLGQAIPAKIEKAEPNE